MIDLLLESILFLSAAYYSTTYGCKPLKHLLTVHIWAREREREITNAKSSFDLIEKKKQVGGGRRYISSSPAKHKRDFTRCSLGPHAQTQPAPFYFLLREYFLLLSSGLRAREIQLRVRWLGNKIGGHRKPLASCLKKFPRTSRRISGCGKQI